MMDGKIKKWDKPWLQPYRYPVSMLQHANRWYVRPCVVFQRSVILGSAGLVFRWRFIAPGGWPPKFHSVPAYFPSCWHHDAYHRLLRFSIVYNSTQAREGERFGSLVSPTTVANSVRWPIVVQLVCCHSLSLMRYNKQTLFFFYYASSTNCSTYVHDNN